MAQAWTKQGRRVVVTKLLAPDLAVIRQLSPKTNNNDQPKRIMLEIGFGKKKLKNMSKSLRTQLERSDFAFGVKQIKGVEWISEDTAPKAGEMIALSNVLSVGDVVDVQGTIKGKGFAGGMKRHGFHGGPATHGQSDRSRAGGSVGAGTSPGRVWKGKKMPGHMGDVIKTVEGLVVLYIDPETNQIWLNGPIPGAFNSIVRIRKTDKTRKIILDRLASGLPAEVAKLVEEINETPELEEQPETETPEAETAPAVETPEAVVEEEVKS